jgi:nitroreductase
VQFDDVVRRRRMVRNYQDAPVPPALLDRVLEVALRGPSAGFTQGVDLLVLEGRDETSLFFELTSDAAFISRPEAMAGLRRAPVIVLPLCDPAAYFERYAQADKSRSGLAELPTENWPVPYWLVDSSFCVMLLLLAASDAGLGTLFFRLHEDPGRLFETLGVPKGRQSIGAVALGYEELASQSSPHSPPGKGRPSGSPARRPRRPISESVHRGRW